VDVQKIPAFIADPQHESCRKISHKLRPSDMEIIPEVVYWAVLLYTPIYWFIGLIVLGGCFIAGTIWSTLACSFRPETPSMSRRSLGLDRPHPGLSWKLSA
jgi:hypothetical protein